MPARPAAALAFALALLAGCVAPAAELGATDAAAPLPPGIDLLSVGYGGAEPTLGVLSDGTILLTGAIGDVGVETGLLRSRDGGATWELVGDPVRDPKLNFDPWMWVDPTTDRAFNVALYIGCSWASWTDDAGETWDANPIAGCGLPAHDHQKLTTGPPPAGVATLGYPNVVYYAYNSFLVTGLAGLVAQPPVKARLGTIVSVSLDGGRTFTPGVVAHESDPCHVGINGPIAVGPDGTAYLPKGTCEGVDIMVSRDAGATWEKRSLNGVGSLEDFAFDPTIAIDGAGTAYAVWPGKDALVHLSASRDGGATWSEPVAITPPEVRATVFSAIATTPEGALTIAYLGTSADPSGWKTRTSSDAPKGTVWDLYVTQSADGGATFTTTRLTGGEADPAQRGCVWMRGGSNDCRNLYDFIDVKVHEDTAYVSYVDGCRACGDVGQSSDNDLMVAKLPARPAPSAP